MGAFSPNHHSLHKIKSKWQFCEAKHKNYTAQLRADMASLLSPSNLVGGSVKIPTCRSSTGIGAWRWGLKISKLISSGTSSLRHQKVQCYSLCCISVINAVSKSNSWKKGFIWLKSPITVRHWGKSKQEPRWNTAQWLTQHNPEPSTQVWHYPAWAGSFLINHYSWRKCPTDTPMGQLNGHNFLIEEPPSQMTLVFKWEKHTSTSS